MVLQRQTACLWAWQLCQMPFMSLRSLKSAAKQTMAWDALNFHPDNCYSFCLLEDCYFRPFEIRGFLRTAAIVSDFYSSVYFEASSQHVFKHPIMQVSILR